MRSFAAVGLMCAILLAAGDSLAKEIGLPGNGALVAQASDSQVCAQVVACGTKDGKRRQYPTPCAARADGAKDVAPMTGASCDEGQ
jgi:hypothetical protein